jgi:hypothetical protein
MDDRTDRRRAGSGARIAGGMGEAYKARDMRLDRTVAIRILAEARAAWSYPYFSSPAASARSASPPDDDTASYDGR